jgi:hypothetical protein
VVWHWQQRCSAAATGLDFAVLWRGDCDGERMWLTAGLWGWLAGGALLIGAALGWFFRLPLRLTAIIMAFAMLSSRTRLLGWSPWRASSRHSR